ncbi:MAG: glycosyltransferase family 4 protein [Candidatus Marinimicrobia bacterium]|nr:glycosyltransferase family 4 protein [Candidatus Neomarinimicrobiota bacterium]
MNSKTNYNKNIFYIISGETGFKKTDEEILKSLGNVRKMDYTSKTSYFNPIVWINLIWCQSIVIWFASVHAIPVILLNYLFNKRLIIIAGGFDVANEPIMRYGGMRGKSRAIIGKWILSRAHSIIAVSKSNKKEIVENARVDVNKIELIYNAIDLKKPNKRINKKQQVLTVGEINEETYLRKGLDRFIKVAEKLPLIQFIHIGKWTNNKGIQCHKMINYVKSISPSNIKYLGFIDKKELDNFYEESKIYLQLSRHEAFGVSVVEAMSYGCVPIVFNAYALPEVVGNNGFIINNIGECKQAINKIVTGLPNLTIDFNPKFNLTHRQSEFERVLAN